MALFVKIAAILLLVLPALISASACQVTVSSRLRETENRYNVYTGTINNIGSGAASDVLITPSTSLRSVSGLKETNRGYTLSRKGIAVGSVYEFSYKVEKGKNVRWTTSCTDAVTSPTTAPTAKPAPTARPATAAPTAKPAATPKPSTPAATAKPTAPAATAKPTTPAGPAATPKPTTPAATPKPAATSQATGAPTSKPTTPAATTKPAATVAPTTKTATSAPSSGGRICPSGTWWAPAPQTTYQWQLTGTIDTSFDVQMYDIDLFDNTAATIQKLHSQGRVVICYFSTQYEDWRSDASAFTSGTLGSNLDDWAGERYADIRSTVVRNVMKGRLDLAVSKGCDGVEPDNVDSYSASSGFPLTAADQLSFNRFMATEAHARGLSIGLKNDLDQSVALEPSFDWALNEQCKEYGECNMLNNFIAKGKAVFNTEYTGSAASICPAMVTSKFSSLIKSLNLDASIKAQCCTYQSNGCAKPAHRCVSSSSARDVEEEEQDTVFAAKSIEALELTTQEVPAVANSASTSFASIAFVVVAAVAALNL